MRRLKRRREKTDDDQKFRTATIQVGVRTESGGMGSIYHTVTTRQDLSVILSKCPKCGGLTGDLSKAFPDLSLTDVIAIGCDCP